MSILDPTVFRANAEGSDLRIDVPTIFRYFERQSGRIRIYYRNEIRKVFTPMLPLFRYGPITAGRFEIYRPSEQIGVIRDMLSEITSVLDLGSLMVRDLERMRMTLPRLESFRRLVSLMGAEVESIDLPLRKLKHLMADHAYKLRSAYERAPSKYAVISRKHPMTAGTLIGNFVQPALRLVQSPMSFGFAVDFSAAGNAADFIAAFFAGLGRNPHLQSQVSSIVSSLLGANYEVTKDGIFRRTKVGTLRRVSSKKLEQIAQAIVDQVILPEIKRVWRKVVTDFFLHEPTSVSRWFPNRPMARKGLGPTFRQQSLLGMMLTGQVALLRHSVGKGGYVGHFYNFNTDIAPYWYVVEYGYHGWITSKSGRGLTLRDPDPSWWQKVQWHFGAKSEKFQLITERRGGQKVGIHYHPGGRLRVEKGRQFISQAKFKTVRLPLLMPTGERFSMIVHPSLLERGGVIPVHYTRGRRTKHVTYSLTIKPSPIIRERVRGQRASLFIERILGMFAEQQTLLEPAFFRAAAAYLYAGEREWQEIQRMFMSTYYRLGGSLRRR